MKLNSTFYIEKFCTRGTDRKNLTCSKFISDTKIFSREYDSVSINAAFMCVYAMVTLFSYVGTAIVLNIVSCEYVIDSKRSR